MHSDALECAWKDSKAFVVLDYDAERSDGTGWRQCSLHQHNVLKAVTKLFHSRINSQNRI